MTDQSGTSSPVHRFQAAQVCHKNIPLKNPRYWRWLANQHSARHWFRNYLTPDHWIDICCHYSWSSTSNGTSTTTPLCRACIRWWPFGFEHLRMTFLSCQQHRKQIRLGNLVRSHLLNWPLRQLTCRRCCNRRLWRSNHGLCRTSTSLSQRWHLLMLAVGRTWLCIERWFLRRSLARKDGCVWRNCFDGQPWCLKNEFRSVEGWSYIRCIGVTGSARQWTRHASGLPSHLLLWNISNHPSSSSCDVVAQAIW